MWRPRLRSRQLAPLVLGGVCLVAGCKKELVRDDVTWEHDIQVAQARSRAEHKPLMIMFGARWDWAAAEYDHVTFADARVRAALARRVVPLYVDMTDDDDPRMQDAVRRFGVVGEPTLLVFGVDGTALTRIFTFVGPRQLVAALDAATDDDPVAASRRAQRLRDEQGVR